MNMRAIRPFLLILLCAFIQSSVGSAEPRKIVTVEGITEYQLDNGLKLLLFPDGSRPTVTVNMTVLVGSRHEGYGEAGMAHLLEHMLFKGTPTYPNATKELKDRGASPNGSTWYDRTNYYETLNATDDNLEFAIRFEADRLMNCFVRREDLLSEMTVVRNEFESGENSPANLLDERMRSIAYIWHNYGKTTIGNRSDIERVPIENLQDFYKRYYQPDNVVLIVAGKFDEPQALNLVQQHFGSIPRPERKLNTTYTEEPPQDGERRVELHRVGDVGIVQAMYHIPSGSHPDFAALQILGSVLSAPPSGRLYKALVETKKASQARARADCFHDPGLFDVFVEVRKDDSLDVAREILSSTLDEVVANGVTEMEVQLARQRFLNSRRAAAVRTSSLAIILSEWIGAGDWRLYFLHRDRVEKVTPTDVQRVAAQYLRPANRTLGYFKPADQPDLVPIPSTPEVTSLVAEYKGKPPVAMVPEFDYSYANVEARTTRTVLPSGIKAALLPKPTRDEKVELTLTLRYGNAENLKEFPEAASLLPSLMTRGTRNLTYQQLQDEMTRLDVRVSGFGFEGNAVFRVSARRGSLPAALDLLRQILREPTLAAHEFETMKPARLASAEQSRTDPASLARNLLLRTQNPYPAGDIRESITPDEEIARLKSLTIEQVRQLYQQYLGAIAGELTIIGDFETEPTIAHLNQILDNWKPAMPYARIERQAFLEVPGGKQSILTPDKANANYEAGLNIAMNDQHSDYPALLLGNYILGGGFLSSRLADRVRQKEGLSYGVGSFFFASSEDNVAGISMNAICNPANIGKVETAIREEFERLLKDGIPADEFSSGKAALLQSRQQARNNESYLASRLGRSLRVEQTLAYDAGIDEKLAGLTRDEVHAALRKHFDPQKLVVVVAGDFAKASAN